MPGSARFIQPDRMRATHLLQPVILWSEALQSLKRLKHMMCFPFSLSLPDTPCCDQSAGRCYCDMRSLIPECALLLPPHMLFSQILSPLHGDELVSGLHR